MSDGGVVRSLLERLKSRAVAPAVYVPPNDDGSLHDGTNIPATFGYWYAVSPTGTWYRPHDSPGIDEWPDRIRKVRDRFEQFSLHSEQCKAVLFQDHFPGARSTASVNCFNTMHRSVHLGTGLAIEPVTGIGPNECVLPDGCVASPWAFLDANNAPVANSIGDAVPMRLGLNRQWQIDHWTGPLGRLIEEASAALLTIPGEVGKPYWKLWPQGFEVGEPNRLWIDFVFEQSWLSGDVRRTLQTTREHMVERLELRSRHLFPLIEHVFRSFRKSDGTVHEFVTEDDLRGNGQYVSHFICELDDIVSESIKLLDGILTVDVSKTTSDCDGHEPATSANGKRPSRKRVLNHPPEKADTARGVMRQPEQSSQLLGESFPEARLTSALDIDEVVQLWNGSQPHLRLLDWLAWSLGNERTADSIPCAVVSGWEFAEELCKVGLGDKRSLIAEVLVSAGVITPCFVHPVKSLNDLNQIEILPTTTVRPKDWKIQARALLVRDRLQKSVKLSQATVIQDQIKRNLSQTGEIPHEAHFELVRWWLNNDDDTWHRIERTKEPTVELRQREHDFVKGLTTLMAPRGHIVCRTVVTFTSILDGVSRLELVLEWGGNGNNSQCMDSAIEALLREKKWPDHWETDGSNVGCTVNHFAVRDNYPRELKDEVIGYLDGCDMSLEAWTEQRIPMIASATRCYGVELNIRHLVKDGQPILGLEKSLDQWLVDGEFGSDLIYPFGEAGEKTTSHNEGQQDTTDVEAIPDVIPEDYSEPLWKYEVAFLLNYATTKTITRQIKEGVLPVHPKDRKKRKIRVYNEHFPRGLKRTPERQQKVKTMTLEEKEKLSS